MRRRLDPAPSAHGSVSSVVHSDDLVAPDEFDRLKESIEREFSENRAFLIVGPARSGTTAIVRTLDTASNARTFSEPLPRLGYEARQYCLGKLFDPRPVIWRNRIERMREVFTEGLIYGEKDQQVYCWLPFYRELFNMRFVLARRDGRDSARSMYDHHYKIHGNLYREIDDTHLLSEQAAERAAQLPPLTEDQTDALRQRPCPDDPVFDEWSQMSRFEMIAWYWSDYVLTAQRDLYRMPDDCWAILDFNRDNNIGGFARTFDFLGLDGFDEGVIEAKLASRIGSFETQSRDSQERYPSWQDWPEDMMVAFDRYAASAMVQCGYYGIERLPRSEGARHDESIRVPQTPVQNKLWQNAASVVLQGAQPLRSVLQVGPHGGGFPDDIVTRWDGGSVASIPRGKFDLVLALGVIDHAPDMDELLIALADRTRHSLVLTSSRGHFDRLIDHRYHWTADGVPCHQWCVAKARSILCHALDFPSVTACGVATEDHLVPTLSLFTAYR